MILRWRDRMAVLLSDELGINGERFRFTATTGCFNRPAMGVVGVVGWSAKEREQVRDVLTRLFRKANLTLADGTRNQDHDPEVEKFWLRCTVELKGDS